MRFFEDRKPREIAEALSIPVSTIHTRIQRGIEALRAELADSYGDWRRATLLLESLVGPGQKVPQTPALPISRILLPVTAVLLALSMALTWSQFSRDPATDFDFILGEWDMTSRGRSPTGVWLDQPPSRSSARRSADGESVIESWDSPNGSGVMVRSYDPEDRIWRIFWTNNNRQQGRLQFWEGRFENGVGEFIGGSPMAVAGFEPSDELSKITFSEIEGDFIRWQLYRSRDAGESWRLMQDREYRRAN
jgi:hypothetical protein